MSAGCAGGTSSTPRRTRNGSPPGSRPVIPLTHLDAAGAKQALENGLLDAEAYGQGQLILTLRGRLLADAVIRDVV
jgi:hypothetical protein